MARVSLVVVLLLPALSLAQDEKQGFGDQPKLGAEHERLKAFVGKWDLTREGGHGKGSAEFKSILGGRFITEETKVPMGDFSLEWMGVYGFDTHKKKYTAVWVDNLDTTTEIGEAEAGAAGNALSFHGEHLDPRTRKPIKFIWRLSRDGDTKLTIEMFEIDADGKEKKALTVRGEKSKELPAGRIPKRPMAD